MLGAVGIILLGAVALILLLGLLPLSSRSMESKPDPAGTYEVSVQAERGSATA